MLRESIFSCQQVSLSKQESVEGPGQAVMSRAGYSLLCFLGLTAPGRGGNIILTSPVSSLLHSLEPIPFYTNTHTGKEPHHTHSN